MIKNPENLKEGGRMKNNRIIYIITTIVLLVLIIANIPSVIAHVPGTNPADPALDPTEVPVVWGPWSFSYGYSQNYGSYLRDVQWNSATFGWERYLGMLSVPYITIQGTRYIPLTGTVNKPAAPLFGPQAGRVRITFIYPVIIDAVGDIHNVQVTFDLWTARAGIGTTWEATIDITAIDTIIPGPAGTVAWTFDVPVRADFDIHDIASPGLDDAWIYLANPAPPPAWIWTAQGIEVTHPGGPGARNIDPVFGMEVMVDDSVLSGAPLAGPWGGIAPHSIVAGVPAGAAPDIFHLVLYRAPPVFEYLGPPAPYVNGQGIAAADNIVWDETFLTIAAPPPPGGSSINVRTWLM